MKKGHRYYVRSPDGRAIFGFDRLEAATVVALEYGQGAALVDTMAQAYYPMVQEVKVTETGKALVYAPVGGWDTGRFTVDRDMIEGVKKGHVAIVHAYLAKGASANARDANGGPALHWAVARGNGQVVELLLVHGADANARDGNGKTPLDVALKKGKSTIGEILRAAGGV
jgi:hypothetical protein